MDFEIESADETRSVDEEETTDLLCCSVTFS